MNINVTLGKMKLIRPKAYTYLINRVAMEPLLTCCYLILVALFGCKNMVWGIHGDDDIRS